MRRGDRALLRIGSRVGNRPDNMSKSNCDTLMPGSRRHSLGSRRHSPGSRRHSPGVRAVIPRGFAPSFPGFTPSLSRGLHPGLCAAGPAKGGGLVLLDAVD